MELRHLEYFIKVANVENISQASRELLIAQPSLSRIISGLETELGVPLFDRRGHRIYLNENGKILYNASCQVFDILSKAKKDIRLQNFSNEHNIYIVINSGSSVIPILAAFFQKDHPDIKIHFRKSLPSNPSECYCYFDSTFQFQANVDTISLMKETCVLAFSNEHRFANMKHISPEDLRGETFLYSDNCHSTIQMAEHLTGQAGFTPFQQIECLGNDSVLSFINGNLGIALLPTMTWSLKRYPNIQTYEFPNIILERTFHMNLCRTHHKAPYLDDFINYCIHFFDHLIDLSKQYNLLHEDLFELLKASNNHTLI